MNRDQDEIRAWLLGAVERSALTGGYHDRHMAQRALAELDRRAAAIERVRKLCERADRIVSGSQRAASIRTSDIRRALDEETP